MLNSIRKKMLFGFGVPILFIIILGSITSYVFIQFKGHSNDIRSLSVQSEETSKFKNILFKLLQVHSAYIGGDDNYKFEYEVLSFQMAEQFQILENLKLNQNLNLLLENLDLNFHRLRSQKKTEDLEITKDALVDLSEALFYNMQESLDEASYKAVNLRDVAIYLILILLVLALLFASISSFVIIKSISTPIQILSKKAREITEGSFETKIELDTNDELQQLASDFNVMTKSLLSEKKISRSQTQLAKELESKNIELKESQAQLVQTAKMVSLGEMASGLAHELNNPLLYISGFANEIKKEVQKSEDVDQQYILESITDLIMGSDKMAKIIKNFREFARGGEPENALTDPIVCINNSHKLLKSQLTLSKIDYSFNSKLSGEKFLGDKTKLEQVLVNLMTNARDALEGVEDKKIKIKAFIAKKLLKIEISDNGSGVAENILSKIFDPFFTTKEVGKGTGLGLSVSHQIIQSFNGELTCSNNKNNKGCTFLISLPVHQEK